MAFGIGGNPATANVHVARGKQKEIAVNVWFTSNGKITPLLVKLEDEDGEIQTIRDITIHSQAAKRYAGIPSIEYDCTLKNENRCIRAWLIFYQTEGRWVLNFR